MHGDHWPFTLWQIALFCLVLKRWFCTFCSCIKASSLKPRICTLATTAFIPRSGLASSEDRFLAVYLLSSSFWFIWLVLRVLIPFPIVLSRCSPSRSLLRYSSLLRYPPLMLMPALVLLSASKDS